MKNKIYYVLMFGMSLLLGTPIAASLGALKSFFPNMDSFEDINNFAIRLEKQLGALKEDRSKLELQQIQLKQEAEKLNNALTQLKQEANAEDKDNSFISQKLNLISQSYQTVSEMEQVVQQIISQIDAHSKLLQEYKQDPEFRNNKNLRIEPKSLYTFADLQKVNDLRLHYEGELKELEEKSKKIQQEVAAREKALQLANQEYGEKKKVQEDFSLRARTEESSDFTIAQKAELIDEEEVLYKYKKGLAQLRLKEVEQRRNYLVDSQMKTIKVQLAIVKSVYEEVKNRLQIDEKYRKQVDADYAQETQTYESIRKKYREHIEALDTTRTLLEEQLNAIKKQFGLTNDDFELIKQWDTQPTTVQGWSIFLAPQIILRKVHEALIRKRELEASIDLERAKLKQSEVNKYIIDTWYTLRTRPDELDTQEEIGRKIKHYERLKDDIQAALTMLAEKRTAAGVNLNANTTVIEKIKTRIKELEKQKEGIFKGSDSEYERDYSRLRSAIDDMRSFGEPLAKIVELYAQAQKINTEALQKIDNILNELQAVSTSKGSPSALLRGLKSFFPDIHSFVKTAYTMIIHFIQEISLGSIMGHIAYYFSDPMHIIYGISQLLIIILLYWFIKLYLPYFRSSLLPAALSSESSFGRFLSRLLYIFCGFLYSYLFPLYCWVLLLIGIKTAPTHPAIHLVFYLFSIPFLMYYAHRFINYLLHADSESEYSFINKFYLQRIIRVFGWLIYATIALQFFREAFLIVSFGKSAIPAIIQAVNFALFQLALIFLVGRKEVLSLIPQKNAWQKIYEFVDKYYYFLLTVFVIIIFMTNPYIGSGSYFLKILARLVLISLLIPIFSAIHAQIKRLSSVLFFQYENDVIKDRFVYAKTAYGLFVIISFAILVAVGLLIGLHIWGYSIGWREISSWLHKELYSAGVDASGRPIIIEPINFIKLFMYVIAGIISAYVVNRFILRRVFELLLVNPGVQSALMSLSRYIIIIAFTVVGFQAVGMGSALLYIFAVLGALGYAAKELVTDFIAYIIILVQRFVKIGDMIELEDETRGVVRHINFRSVILRKKNSVTVVVPNNLFITQRIINWNYSRTFFAFDDIYLVVPYSADPRLVREIILKTLSGNMNILKTPAPIVNLRDFVENGYQFLVRGFMSPEKVLEQLDIASDLRMDLVSNLRAHNIHLATPVRTIKVVQPEEVNEVNIEESSK